ncbi:hypothetical protein BCEN4_930005 [Burkholderia cenocepacia]|nr:hypothetical protein BCEN4_930005 [Burkholderia cenocepacia]
MPIYRPLTDARFFTDFFSLESVSIPYSI